MPAPAGCAAANPQPRGQWVGKVGTTAKRWFYELQVASVVLQHEDASTHRKGRHHLRGASVKCPAGDA